MSKPHFASCIFILLCSVAVVALRTTEELKQVLSDSEGARYVDPTSFCTPADTFYAGQTTSDTTDVRELFARLKAGEKNVQNTGTTSIVFHGTYEGRPAAFKTLPNSPASLVLIGNELFFYLKTFLAYPADVPEFFDCLSTDNAYFITIELFDADLWELIASAVRTGKTSFTDELRIFRRLAEIITHLQAIRIIHHDVRPNNFFFRMTEKGVDIRIGDFGLSQAQLTGDRYEGNLPYMAPEKINGKYVNKRADTYALGITIWAFYTDDVATSAECYQPNRFSRACSAELRKKMRNFFANEKGLFTTAEFPNFVEAETLPDALWCLLKFDVYQRPAPNFIVDKLDKFIAAEVKKAALAAGGKTAGRKHFAI